MNAKLGRFRSPGLWFITAPGVKITLYLTHTFKKRRFMEILNLPLRSLRSFIGQHARLWRFDSNWVPFGRESIHLATTVAYYISDDLKLIISYRSASFSEPFLDGLNILFKWHCHLCLLLSGTALTIWFTKPNYEYVWTKVYLTLRTSWCLSTPWTPEDPRTPESYNLLFICTLFCHVHMDR